MWNPPGHQPGVHVPGTTVPIPYAMANAPAPYVISPEEARRKAEVAAKRREERERRLQNLTAQAHATRDSERRLALAVTIALTATSDDQAIMGDPGDLHQLCPAYFGPNWRWTHDPQCLITYTPERVSRWFASEAAAISLPPSSTFKWIHTTSWGREKPRQRDGWCVGSSTFAPGGRPPFAAWVFPDGSYALSAVPEKPGKHSDLGNFSPSALDTMATKLGLDQPIE